MNALRESLTRIRERRLVRCIDRPRPPANIKAEPRPNVALRLVREWKRHHGVELDANGVPM